MSIVARFNPANLSSQQYDEVLRRLEAEGLWPVDGRVYHVCFGSEGHLKVSEIWDSEEHLQAFGERLPPILSDVGVEFSGEPEISDVRNTYKRQTGPA